jgi:hypothetical protein
MKTFFEWLNFNENQINPQQVQQIIASHKGPLDISGIRTDMIDNAFKIGNQVEYDPAFPIAKISKRMQGFDTGSVLAMINKMLSNIGLQQANTIADIKTIPNLQQNISKLSEMIPPAILSILPDETVSLMDGNHRYGASIMLGLPTIKTFIIR